MPVAAIVPIRSFTDGKERLATALDPERRSSLATGMASRTITAAESAGMLPIVVTADTGVTSWAIALGIPVIPETGRGLDAAAADGVVWAGDNGLEWAILHSDLPLVTGADLGPVVSSVESGNGVLAPSSDGGTSVLSSPQPIEFRYGPLSAQRHLAQMRDAEIVARVGLLHDIDTINDLYSAMTHDEGGWLRDLVA